MFLILTYTANIFDKMIIAGAGSITARGGIETYGGVEVLWSQWFLAFLPCSILTLVAAWWFTLKLYPPEQVGLAGGYEFLREELRKMGPLAPRERNAALLILAAIVLWLTDFIHHISPAVIGIGVGLFAMLPRIEIIKPQEMRRLNYMPVFFVAAAVSMGTVMEATKGIEVLTQHVLAWMQPLLGNIVVTTTVMYWTAFLYHFLLASEISMLGTSIPLVMDLAKTSGFNHRRLFVWLFRRVRSVAHGRVAHGDRIPDPGPAGAALVAADRHQLVEPAHRRNRNSAHLLQSVDVTFPPPLRNASPVSTSTARPLTVCGLNVHCCNACSMPLRCASVARITCTCRTAPSRPMMMRAGIGIGDGAMSVGATLRMSWSPVA
jgi:hypothetical protein